MNKENRYEFRLLLSMLFLLTEEQDAKKIKKHIKRMERWIEDYADDKVEEVIKPLLIIPKINENAEN